MNCSVLAELHLICSDLGEPLDCASLASTPQCELELSQLRYPAVYQLAGVIGPAQDRVRGQLGAVVAHDHSGLAASRPAGRARVRR